MRTDSRFDANKVVGLATLTGERRLEMKFCDSDGKTHVVSLPLRAAVEFACLVCDASDAAPYLVGGQRRAISDDKP
jgi:hypothetical protein